MKRRGALIAFVAAPLTVPADDALAALRSGGVALVLRHALTEPGIGDPPGFRLGACTTQRNLSAEGREQAKRLGVWLTARGLRPARVRSSPWCRCLDTARLAFGTAEIWPALASTFDEAQRRDAQSATLRAALAELPPRGFEAWVTHQVNVLALLGAPLPMGHALVVRGERSAGAVTVHNLGALAFE